MKRIIQRLAVLILLTGGPLSLAAQSDNKTDLNAETREKIDQINSKLSAAMQKGDLNQVMDLYADDATLMVPGGKSLKGKKDISGYLAGMKNIRNVKIQVTDAGGSGKIIYQVGKATITTQVNGTDKEETTDFVMVLKRQSDWDYKISVNSSN